MKPSQLILEAPAEGIKIVKISRPSALNALNLEILKGLKEVLLEISDNPKVRVVIITGDGDKAFVAGADIHEMKNKTVSEGVEFSQVGHEVTKLLESMPKPTLAAVNGFALGGGTELAISCDFILASEKAVFGLPEVSLGVIPGFGGTLRLSKFVGLPRAKELIFSGRKVDAQEAFALGLVNHLFPVETFMEQTIQLAEKIRDHSQGAIAKAKQLLNEFSESYGLNYKLDAEAQAFGRLFESQDQKEGMQAFIEKRKPNFS